MDTCSVDTRSPPDAGLPAIPAPDTDTGLTRIVDRLIVTVGQMLPAGSGATAAGTRPDANDPPARRLSDLASRIDSLSPPARAVMQSLFSEICGQLGEIRRISHQLETLAQHNLKAVQAAEAASRTDPLTGLLNRRGFDDAAQSLLDLSPRADGRVTLIFADLDCMKDINDSRGHDAGDLALKVAAQALKQSFRAHDLVARWGGDEFAVLSTSLQLGEPMIRQRILDNLERARRATPACPPIGLSIGFVQERMQGLCTVDEMLRRADHRMYAVKRQRDGAGDRTATPDRAA